MDKWSNFDLESLLGMSVSEVDEITSNKSGNLREFDVPKRKGGKRHIVAPMPRYKYMLNAINWRVLSMYRPSDFTFGFVKNRSVVHNARKHLSPKSIGSIDIKDFFNSINETHLKNTLFGNKKVCKGCKNFNDMQDGKCSISLYDNKNNNYIHKCEEVMANIIPNYEELTGYQSLLSRVLKAVTYNGYTPQGFPTSPALANIALKSMDKKINEECMKINVVYTRYADDLSFSSKEEDKIWLKDNTLGMATSILKAWKFQVNKRKTKYTGRGGRMMACGVVVNDVLSLPKWRIKQFRAEVYNATVKNPENTTDEMLKKMIGFASWITSIKPSVGGKYMQILKEFKDGKLSH